MAILDDGHNKDLTKLWGMVTELSDQLSKNKHMAELLLSQSAQLKAQAIHAGTGFALRRFNMDLPKEEFESELQRMNTALSIENQGLQNDNKQLNALLKEYELSLESVMSAFRVRANEVQQRELSLMRHYESMLISGETCSLEEQLSANASVSICVERVSRLLRMTIRVLGGEEPEPEPPATSVVQGGAQEGRGYTEQVDVFDWALERECELVRLEKENEELRRMLDVGNINQELRRQQADGDELVDSRRRSTRRFQRPEGIADGAM